MVRRAFRASEDVTPASALRTDEPDRAHPGKRAGLVETRRRDHWLSAGTDARALLHSRPRSDYSPPPASRMPPPGGVWPTRAGPVPLPPAPERRRW
jgi:hypothetical protein